MDRLSSQRRCTIILVGIVIIAMAAQPTLFAPAATTALSTTMRALLKKKVRIRNGYAVFTGKVRWLANKTLQSCHGTLRMGADGVQFPDRGPQQLSLQRVGTTARVDASRTLGGTLTLNASHGLTRIASVGYAWLHASALVMHWDLSHGCLHLRHFQSHALGGTIDGTAALLMSTATLQITCSGTNINQATLLAHFSPQRFDIMGPADFAAALTIHFSGAITGTVSVRSTKPGTLRMYRIPVLASVLTTTGYSQLDPVLRRMLRAYPYQREKITIAATARRTMVQLSFDRNKSVAAKSQTVVITLHGQKVKVRPEIPHIHKTFIAPPIRQLWHVMLTLFTPEKPDHD